MAKKDIVKEELEKSTNKKVVKKKKKGEEASNEDVVIQDEIALSSSSSEEGISSGDEVAGSFWSENGWLIAGGTLGVLGGVALVSGGSSKSGGGVEHHDTSSTTLSVQDGKISGAMVFTDGNNNGQIDFTDSDNDGIYDIGETLLNGDAYLGTTDSNGDLSVSSSLVAGKAFVTQGGTDITTGLEVTVNYTAVSGSTIINPLSTLVQELVEGGKTQAQAESLVKTALGIDSAVNLSSYDPTKDTNTTASLSYQKAAIQVANLLTIAENLDGVDSSDAVLALASQIASSTTTLDLTNSSVIETFLEDTLTNAGTTTTLVVSDIADSIANANDLIKNSTTLADVVSIQKVAQDDIANAVENKDNDSLEELANEDTFEKIVDSQDDTTAPTLELTALDDAVLSSLSEQQNYSQTLNVSDVNLKSVTAVVKDSSGKTIKELTINETKTLISADLSSLEEGTYTIEVTATDYAGNTTVKTQTIGIGAVSAITDIEISNDYINATEDDSDVTVSGSSLGLSNGAIITIALGSKTYSATVGNDGKWSVIISSNDIQALSQGVNTLSASSQDAPTVSSSFIYDTTAPTLVVGTYALSADSKSGSSFAYSYIASDVDSGVSTVSAVIKEASGVTLSASNGKITGDISSLTKGSTYTLQITATDTAGNTTSKEQTFTYNTTTAGSALSLYSLSDVVLNTSEAALYSQNFSWTYLTAKVVTTVKVYDANDVEMTGVNITASSSESKLSGDLSSLSDGIYKIVVKLNYSGEIVYKEQLITIDKSAPTLTLGTLSDTVLDDSEVASYAQTFSAVDTNGNGIDSVVVKVKNSNSDVVKQTTLSSSYGDLKGVLDSLSNGTYTIEVTATDEAGNSITKTQAITISSAVADTVKPTVEITDNVDGTARGDVTYTITFSEAVSGFDVSDVSVTNGTKGTFTQVNAYTYTLVVTPTASTIGDITVQVAKDIAQDASGNNNTASNVSTQAYDTATEAIAPTLVLGSKAVSSDSKSAGSFAYSYAATDASGIESVTAKIKTTDGADSGVALNVGNGLVTGNLSSLATGTYVIELTAIDEYGNITTKTQEFAYNTSSSGTAIVLEQLSTNVFNTTDAATYSQHVSWTSTSNVTVTTVVKDANGNTVEGITLIYDATNKLVSGDLSSLANGIYHIEITANYRGTDIQTKEQIIVIDSTAVSHTVATSDDLLFSSDIASLAGVSANSSAYFTEFADYDGDGDLDLLIGSNSTSAESKLYSNDGDGIFTDVTASTIGSVKMSLGGMAFVDYDKDGDLDIIMASGSASVNSKILQNNNGVYTDVATTAGISTATAIKSVNAIDYDNDGDTDLYFTSQAGENKLYSNNGDGTFTDVTTTSGVGGTTTTQDQQALWGDFDKDGDLDLFVAVNNLYTSMANSKYYTNNGDGTFTETTSTSIGDISMTTVDAVVGDYDGDGDLDIFIAGNVDNNKLLQNDGTGKFTDVALSTGVAGNSAAKVYGAEFTDIDSDGDLDIITTGVNNTTIYLNDGDGTFSDATTASGISNAVAGRDIVVADIDGDTDNDLVVISSSSPLISVYENLKVDTDKPTVTITDSVSQTEVINLKIGAVANSTVYSLTLNGTTISYTSDSSATITEIYAGLKSAIEANTTTAALVTVGSSLATDSFALISKVQAPLSVSGTGITTDSTISNAVIGIVDLGTVLSETTYSVTINGETVSYTSDKTPTYSEIHLGLQAAIEANSTLNALVNVASSVTNTDQFVLTAKTDSGFSVSSSGGYSTSYISANEVATGDITYTFTFLEPVSGFTVEDVSVTNGIKGTFTQVSEKVYTLVVTPTDESTDNLSVSVDANKFKDLASNDNIASDTTVQKVNTKNAVITITDNTESTATSDVTYTFTFNEDVTGFTVDDIIVQNGTKGTFTQVSASVYTLVVTPDSEEVGNITVSVAENVAQDSNSNGNLAVINTLQTFDTDTTAPVLTITDNISAEQANGNIIFTFTFSEYVTGFATADITVTNGSKGSFVTIETGKIYQLIVSPYETGDVTVTVAENLLTDLGANGNITVTATQSYTDVGMINTASLGDEGFIITGTASAGRLGYSVSDAGDVNGDGLADVVIGAYRETTGTTSGAVYVVFGKTDATTVDVSNLGTNGYKIYNSTTTSRLGTSVSEIGDINGDGLSDLLISGNTTNGRAYVVYGKTTTTDIDLANLTASQGFSLTGPSDVLIGKWVSAGDIDGDGIDDIMVSNSSSSAVSSTYIVFGKSITAGTTASIDLTQIVANTQGIIVKGVSGTSFGNSISYIGDVNGDGIGDMLISAPTTKNATKTTQSDGAAYVVYGTGTSQIIDVSTLTTSQGYKITGPIPTETAVTSVQFAQYVGAAGDVNGDGIADMIIGSSNSAVYGYKAYVVFGQTGTSTTSVDVTNLGSNGFIIQSNTNSILGVGSSVSYAGDINGDGLADVIVGASSGNQAYVVYGKTTTTTVDLDQVANGIGGFVINGGVSASSTGISVSYAGDINGDGFDDLIVGASAAAITVTNEDGTTTTTSNVGQSYVIFGGSSEMTTLDYSGTSSDDIFIGTTSSETAVLGTGNDIYTANGGADVIYAGAGNDTIILNADNIAKLEAGVTDGQLAKIDGGAGSDIIKLDGSGITFDLTKISNVLGEDSRIESIEKIDITGSGNNTLKISLSDVLDINSTQLLTIDGNSGDSVNLLNSDGWTLSATTVTENSNTYSVYTSGNGELRIDTDATVTMIA